MKFCTLVLQLYENNGQKKKGRCYLSEEKKQEKENSATIMISADGKGTAFPVKLKLQEE